MQDTVLPKLKQKFADKKGYSRTTSIKLSQCRCSDRKGNREKLPDVLKEDGYLDAQVFMETCRKAENVAEQYNRDIAALQVRVKQKPAKKGRQRRLNGRAY